jgi:hypothetical protein
MLRTHLPNQSNSPIWKDKTGQLPLVAGNNVITYKLDVQDSGNVNLDYITVPFDADTGRYEAESAELSRGADGSTNHFFYSGGGFVDKIESDHAEVAFKIYVPSAGSYKAALRYANATGITRTLSLLVNDSKVKQVSLPNLANWDRWVDQVDTVTLKSGLNTIAYKLLPGDTGHVNIDRLLVSKTAPKIPLIEKNRVANGNFEQGNISGWSEWHEPGSEKAYNVNFYDVNTMDKKCYFEKSSAYKQSIHQVCPVENGDYQMTAYVWLRKNKPNVAQVEIENYGDAPIHRNLTQTENWAPITIDNIHVTTGKVKIGFYVDSPGGTLLLIDDAKLIKK